MAVRLNKPWRRLVLEEVNKLGGQLGVYELANDQEEVILIGCAGGKTLFGLKGELRDQIGSAALFRVEVNTAYHTRHRELLMAYFADHGHYPPQNTKEDTRGLGVLSPAGS